MDVEVRLSLPRSKWASKASWKIKYQEVLLQVLHIFIIGFIHLKTPVGQSIHSQRQKVTFTKYPEILLISTIFLPTVIAGECKLRSWWKDFHLILDYIVSFSLTVAANFAKVGWWKKLRSLATTLKKKKHINNSKKKCNN